MKTISQVFEEVKRLRENPEEDFLGVRLGILVDYLTKAHIKELIPSMHEAELGKVESKPLTEEQVKADMATYMDFAIDKALHHRGISAARSLEKFYEWCWLIDDVAMMAYIKDPGAYSQYGVPVLKSLATKYKFNWPLNEMLENMGKGLKCIPECEEGCGK